jgi:hypothetical protein
MKLLDSLRGNAALTQIKQSGLAFDGACRARH